MKLNYIIVLLSCFSINIIGSAQVCELIDITTEVSVVLPACFRDDGSIVLSETEGGTPPYQYTLGDTAISRLGSFFNLGIGVYSILVEDGRGCQKVFEVKLQYKELDNIIRPYNAFTPNGDKVNDIWIIPGIESFKGSEVRVFNRWGQQVHLNSEYDNDLGWDGTQNGSPLPAGTYYYVISIVNNCVEEYLKGTVTIIK